MLAVAPQDVGKHWKKLRPILERLEKHGTDGWIPEDVYTLLVSNQATLYIADGEWDGFVVLQLIPQYSLKRLHIWIGHCVSDPAIYIGKLKMLAQQLGASRITFDSPRKGWEKRAERLGFRPTLVTYVLDI